MRLRACATLLALISGRPMRLFSATLLSFAVLLSGPSIEAGDNPPSPAPSSIFGFVDATSRIRHRDAFPRGSRS